MAMRKKAFSVFAFLIVSFVAEASQAPSWERPRTTRRYLHPPMAECMYTLWNDGIVMHGENLHRHDWYVPYGMLMADALWVMHGPDDVPLDFKTAKNRLPSDGVPFHGLTWRQDGLEVDIDAFCETGVRKPACLVRLTFRNEGPSAIRTPFAVFLRRMPESAVVKGTPDIYMPYETRVAPFLRAPVSAFRADAVDCLKGEITTVRAVGLPPDARWDASSGALRFTAAPSPGHPIAITFTMAMHDSPVRPEDWDFVRGRAQAFWHGELAKLNRLPPEIRDDAGRFRLVQNLTVQMLQCFCHPVSSDLVIPRQGGLQRFVWPWDCKDMLAALGLIGDFGDYVEGALDLYFREYAREDGCIGPFRNDWICNTGECVASLARYCLDNDNQIVWNRHRAAALRAFDWMCRTRASSTKSGKGVAGLFPVAESTDNPTPIQLWGFTDMLNLEALSRLACAARRFGEPRAVEIEAERDALLKVIAGIYGRFSRAAEGRDEMRIPITPDGNDAEFIKAGYFDTGQGYVLHTGLEHGFAPTNDVMKVYRWCLRSGKANPHGLCANHPPSSNLSDPHVWYTTSSERYWYDCFLRINRKDLANKVLDATLRYSVTDEFYVGERYRDDNPWYFPWSPNASGSGRIILMLLGRM